MPSADIDFTGTESSGYLTGGTYHARLQLVEVRDGKEFPLWSWIFASVEPETFGRKSQITTSLSPKAAFFLRQVIEGLGVEVPASMARINTDKYLGREAMVFVAADGTFTGRDGQERDSFKIQRVFPLGEGVQEPGRVIEEDDLPPEAFAGSQVPQDDIPF
jgi:hypothetical protein